MGFSSVRRVLAGAVVVAAAVGGVAGGYALAPAAGPSACRTPLGVLPSGDAGTFGAGTFVCTDGVWVPVSSYGVAGVQVMALRVSRGVWDVRVCGEFSGRRRGWFTRMVSDARHADAYLRVDVGLWVRDRSRHAAVWVLRRDEGFVQEDCAYPDGYGL